MERRKKGIVLILIAILIFGVFAGVEFFGKKKKRTGTNICYGSNSGCNTDSNECGNDYSENHRQMQKPKKIKKALLWSKYEPRYYSNYK